jgi:hypothetical protein
VVRSALPAAPRPYHRPAGAIGTSVVAPVPGADSCDAVTARNVGWSRRRSPLPPPSAPSRSCFQVATRVRPRAAVGTQRRCGGVEAAARSAVRTLVTLSKTI